MTRLRIHMPIQGVIFDLDGVLIHSATAHLESWRRLAARHGIGVGDAQFSSTFGRQNRDIVPLLWGRDLSREQVERLGEEKESLYRDIVRGHVASITMPGAAELVRDCQHEGLRLAIGSSTPPENVELALGEMGLMAYFSAKVTSRDIMRGKPAPDVFLTAAKRIELPAADCVVIEDAPAGIEAALSAGCAAVGLTSQHPREALTRAHLVVDRLTQLSASVLKDIRP